MAIFKKRLTMALTLAFCTMLISAPLALAEETTEPVSVAENIGQISDTPANSDLGIPAVPVVPEEPVVPEVPVDPVDPGTLPDSPIYWLTTLIEKIQVILTFDPVEKTELLAEQGLERIAEAEAMIEQGDTELAEVALAAYTEKVAEAHSFLALLNETDSATLLKLETALSKTHAQNVRTLGGLLDKLPPQAAQRVALNIVRSMEKTIAKMDKKDLRMAALEVKKMTKGIEDSELEEDLDTLENLEQLDLQEGEETTEPTEPTSGVSLNSIAITTTILSDTTTETIKNGQKSLVQAAKSKVSDQKTEGKVELKTVMQQEQPLKAEGKVLEQQASKPKADTESTLTAKKPSSNNPVQKLEVVETQQKAQKESVKGDKSGGKER